MTNNPNGSVTAHRSYTVSPKAMAFSMTVQSGVTLPISDGEAVEEALRRAHRIVDGSILEELERLEELTGGFKEKAVANRVTAGTPSEGLRIPKANATAPSSPMTGPGDTEMPQETRKPVVRRPAARRASRPEPPPHEGEDEYGGPPVDDLPF